MSGLMLSSEGKLILAAIAVQADHTPEIREAQLKAKKLAETMAKAPPGWQAAQQGSAYLPNGELNPLVVAAQQAAMKLAQQVCLKFP